MAAIAITIAIAGAGATNDNCAAGNRVQQQQQQQLQVRAPWTTKSMGVPLVVLVIKCACCSDVRREECFAVARRGRWFLWTYARDPLFVSNFCGAAPTARLNSDARAADTLHAMVAMCPQATTGGGPHGVSANKRKSGSRDRIVVVDMRRTRSGCSLLLLLWLHVSMVFGYKTMRARHDVKRPGWQHNGFCARDTRGKKREKGFLCVMANGVVVVGYHYARSAWMS